MLNLKQSLLIITAAAAICNAALPAQTFAAETYTNITAIHKNYNPFEDKYKDDDGPKITITKPAPGHAFLPKGTVVPMELLETLDSRTAKPNQKVKLRTTANVYANGNVVIPAYTYVDGYIYRAGKPGAFGKGGHIRISCDEIVTATGFRVPLMKGLIAKGSKDSGGVAVAAAVTVIGGAFMKGQNVTIESGTTFNCEVRENTDLGY